MIQMKNVFKKYLYKTVLQDVTLTLPEGKIIGIVGENGAGKSTLLKMIVGLIRPNHGTILFDDKVVTRRICDKVGYLSELDMYYPFYTIAEMICFYASQFRDFCLETAEELLRVLNLDSTQKVKNLSKGGKARVKLLLTLSRKAPVILLDEPFSGLDPIVRKGFVKALISYVDLNKQTVIMTTMI